MIKLYIFLCWVEWVLCMFWMLTSSQKYYLQISSPIQWVFFLFCQHNLYQNANGIFHKTRRSNSKISMETQKSPNSQSSFKKEKLIKLYHTPWFQTKLQSYGYQNSMLIYCCSVSRPCPTLCDLTHCSVPAFPVLHHLPELAQTHVHWDGDAIQPSHPLSSPEGGNGNSIQYSCLKNPTDRAALWATIHGGRKELDTPEHVRTLTYPWIWPDMLLLSIQEKRSLMSIQIPRHFCLPQLIL